MFRDDQKSLRRWDPALGLSLRGFVGLLAQRRVAEIMRTAKRSPWSDRVATLSGEHTSEAVNPEETALSRQLLDRLLFRLEAMLSPRGYELFVRLYVNEESVAAVSAALNINSNAVHQWKHRLAVAAREALRELGHQDLAERSEGVQPATIAASRPEAEP